MADNLTKAFRQWDRLTKRGWHGELRGPLPDTKPPWEMLFKRHDQVAVGAGMSAEDAILVAADVAASSTLPGEKPQTKDQKNTHYYA